MIKVVACLEYLCYQLVGDSWVFLSANLFARCNTFFDQLKGNPDKERNLGLENFSPQNWSQLFLKKIWSQKYLVQEIFDLKKVLDYIQILDWIKYLNLISEHIQFSNIEYLYSPKYIVIQSTAHNIFHNILIQSTAHNIFQVWTHQQCH